MSDPLEPQALYLTATSIQGLVEHLGELFIVMFLVKWSYYSSSNKGSVEHLGELFSYVKLLQFSRCDLCYLPRRFPISQHAQ